MKYITREIKIYRYTFGKINIDDNSVYGLTTKETAEPLGKREIAAICESGDGCVLLKREAALEKFAMPVQRFVDECREYNAAAIPADEQLTDEADNEADED